MDVMYGWRIALWAAGIVAAGAAMLLFHRAATDSSVLPFLLCVVLAFVFVLAAESYATGRKQRERRESFIQTFGSVDELRQVIDGPGLRQIRDEGGRIGALRELKRQYPGIPIDMAATLIKEL
ncbi:hypothetical protein [Streptomyces sp. NBC_01022]|uniref:hypothetical protein n=1 Tax=Streptomyces sp. NBC_01022 TaxID=2903723 RepID=UPI002DDC517C|nr:hypothetical protein [Streptomyces sp. NBC_01022]WRZ82392.1 hypothetical protein OG316_20080 [Streptomyces sp. NBC_01022]